MKYSIYGLSQLQFRRNFNNLARTSVQGIFILSSYRTSQPKSSRNVAKLKQKPCSLHHKQGLSFAPELKFGLRFSMWKKAPAELDHVLPLFPTHHVLYQLDFIALCSLFYVLNDKLAIFAEQHIVHIDFAVLAQVADQVPVDRRMIYATSFGIRFA